MSKPEEIRPVLERAGKKVEQGIVGFVNVNADAPRRCASPAAKPERKCPPNERGTLFCYGSRLCGNSGV